MGMSHLAAYSTQSSRVRPQTRAGAIDLEVGRQGAGPHLEADLVVALAGAAVGHGGGAVPPGLGHQVACTMTGRDRADTSGYLPS